MSSIPSHERLWTATFVALSLTVDICCFICVAYSDNAANKVLYIGEDGYLECSRSGAKIAWTFYANLDPTVEREISYMSRLVDKSGKFNITSDGHLLIILNVTGDDAGRYVCDQLERSGPKRQRFNVTVRHRETSEKAGTTADTVSESYSRSTVVWTIISLTLLIAGVITLIVIVFLCRKYIHKRSKGYTASKNDKDRSALQQSAKQPKE